MRLLSVGSGSKPYHLPERIRQEDFEEILGMDINPELVTDFTMDISSEDFELEDEFDVVVAWHVLEHIKYTKIPQTIRNLRDLVVDGGELWIATPSLKWAAEAINKGESMHPALMGVLFGSQENEWEYHRSGFRLDWLRDLVQEQGMVPRHIHHATYIVAHNEQQYPVVEARVIAMRNKELERVSNDPALALAD